MTGLTLLVVLVFRADGAGNFLTIREVAGERTRNYPVQIGRAFARGEIRNTPAAVIDGEPAPTQADVKTRWPDGSVEHVIVSFLLPVLEPGQIVRVDFEDRQDPGGAGLSLAAMLDPRYDFDARMELTEGLTVAASAREMLQAGEFQYWTSGPIATTILLADHSPRRRFDLGFDAHRSYRPIFHVTFWPQIERVRVRFIGEVAHAEALQDLVYSLALKLGQASPETVYRRENLRQHAASRWTREFWIGGAPPEVEIDHNLADLAGTKLLADSGPAVSEEEMEAGFTAWRGAAREALGTGNWDTRMEGQARMPVLPVWTRRWLATADRRMRQQAFGNAELAAAWPVHVRGTARPPVGPVSDGGWVASRPHQPDAFSPQYLLSGDFFYLEQMHFWADWSAREWPRPPAAWTLRSLARTAALTPDDSPRKGRLEALVRGWQSWMEAPRGQAGMPVVLSITSPAPGAVLTGASVTVNYTVSGDVAGNGVAQVRFQLDARSEVRDKTWDGVYRFSSVPAGPHTLRGWLARSDRTPVPGAQVLVAFFTQLAPSPDTAPPVITSVAAGSIGASSAVIGWSTNEAADSQVEYGLTAAFGQSSSLDPSRVTTHSVTLAGLTAATLYHYRVKSRDAAGNLAVSAGATLTTTTSGGGNQQERTTSPPINAVSGQTIRNVKITNPSGPCITLHNVTNVWIENVEVGPCAGNGVKVTGGSAIRVTNSLIHTERAGPSDTGVGLYIANSTDVLAQGNQFERNESSVWAVESGNLRLIGNYSKNPLGPFPRGQHFQYDKVTGGEIRNNYGVAIAGQARQEDAINIYMSKGITVSGNYVTGGDSPSGCGIITDGTGPDNNLIENNTLIRTAQCGVGIAAGANNIVRGNKVLDTNIPNGSGNTGIYVWNQYPGTCAGIVVENNIISNRWPNGQYNDYWDGGNCGSVTFRGNILGAEARALLTPESTRLPPPPIPPQPYTQ